MKLLQAKALKDNIYKNITQEIQDFKNNNMQVPGLAVVLIGEDPASEIYVNHKIKACQSLGFYSVLKKLKKSSTKELVKKEINKLNQDSRIHGILLQLPIPACFNEQEALSWIDPKKDVDALTLYNRAKLWSGTTQLIPCTPKGIISLLKFYKIPIKSQKAVVVGRSHIVGLPIFQQLLIHNATVTICHSYTKNLSFICRQADIIVVCVGQAEFLSKKDFKQGATVIDVGIHKKNNKLVGDVCLKDLDQHLGALSPVPGGVGPMTIASLMENCIFLARSQHNA